MVELGVQVDKAEQIATVPGKKNGGENSPHVLILWVNFVYYATSSNLSRLSTIILNVLPLLLVTKVIINYPSTHIFSHLP